MDTRVRKQLKLLACRRRWVRDGSGSVAVCLHRIFRRHRQRRQDGTCRWPSGSRLPYCAPRAAEFERLRGNLHEVHQQSHVNCAATLPREAEDSRIARSRHSGMLIAQHDAPSAPNWRLTPHCGAMSKSAWLAMSPLRRGGSSLVLQLLGRAGAMDEGNIDGGHVRGVRNKSLTACQSTSRAILQCALATKRFTSRCTSKDAAPFVVNSPPACARDELYVYRERGYVGVASPSSRQRFSSASVLPKWMIAPFPDIGKATSSLAWAAPPLARS